MSSTPIWWLSEFLTLPLRQHIGHVFGLCCWSDRNRCFSLGILRSRHWAKGWSARSKGVTEVIREEKAVYQRGILSQKPWWANDSSSRGTTLKINEKRAPRLIPAYGWKSWDINTPIPVNHWSGIMVGSSSRLIKMSFIIISSILISTASVNYITSIQFNIIQLTRIMQ